MVLSRNLLIFSDDFLQRSRISIPNNHQNEGLLVEQNVAFAILNCGGGNFRHPVVIKLKPPLTVGIKRVADVVTSTCSADVANHGHEVVVGNLRGAILEGEEIVVMLSSSKLMNVPL
jgi:hypothetical protein